LTYKNIPEDIENLIIKPLLDIEATNWSLMHKSLQDFLENTIKPQIDKYIEIIEENLNWFLDLEEKRKFEEWLYQKNPSTFKTYFREYNNLLNYLCNTILEKIDSENIELIEKFNDIILESNNRRGYYYNIKFYYYNESILDLKENIKKIVNKIVRMETLERKNDLGLTLPRWSEFEYSFDSGILFNIDFIENILKVNHNNLYITTYFFKDKKRKNFWEEGPSNLIELLKEIIKEIFLLNNLKLINLFDIPDEFKFEIEEIAEKLSKRTIKEKDEYDILGEEEGHNIEYKETFRWDIKNKNKNRKLKEEVSKAVVPFSMLRVEKY